MLAPALFIGAPDERIIYRLGQEGSHTVLTNLACALGEIGSCCLGYSNSGIGHHEPSCAVTVYCSIERCYHCAHGASNHDDTVNP